MRVTQFGQHAVQLTRFATAFPMNCYLVSEDDGLTLVDTTIASSAPAIMKVVKSLELPLKRIVLTHAHGDHVGAVDALLELAPEAELIVSERDARFLAGDMSLDADEPQSKLRGGYQTIKAKPSRLVKNGDIIGSLLVLAAPGHTPGQIAVVDMRDGSMTVGDAFQTRAGLAVAGSVRWMFPFPALATWHKPSALETAKRLRALKPRRIGAGHGNVLEDPLAQMDLAIAKAQIDFAGAN